MCNSLEEMRAKAEAKGRKEGRKEGREETIKAIAIRMLKNRRDATEVSKYTGISVKDIKKLAEAMAQTK